MRELIFFQDPAGNTVELFYGPLHVQDVFAARRSISGFRTGSLGLGHVVLTVENIEPVTAFYRDLLGFKLSDCTLAPFKAWFFHINARHHSLAFVQTGRYGLHHLMIELIEFDDVGQAYDLAQLDPERMVSRLDGTATIS